MKKATKNIILLLLTIFVCTSGYAAPPAPTQQAPITPPLEPIDENIIILVFIALSFGLYTIYRNKSIKKASN